ncbi:MAG: hypothetical protein Q8O61_12740 [Nocardioides sp.]|nr:hypothetical protein [Nocardioides sp.]
MLGALEWMILTVLFAALALAVLWLVVRHAVRSGIKAERESLLRPEHSDGVSAPLR